MSPSVFVGASGGVDSLCAILLLKKAGFKVKAVHGLFIESNGLNNPEASLELLHELCSHIKVELLVADFRKVFTDKVILPFCTSYFEGKTPNPCILCNREIKFGILKNFCHQHGADFFATGHYARISFNPYSSHPAKLVKKAYDKKKDQSYFLARLDQKQLENLIFPLGGLQKEEVRKIVSKYGFEPPVKKESQDICFVSGGSLAAFLRQNASKFKIFPSCDGPIYLQKSAGERIEIGRHKGLWNYTHGQRKGLGVAWKEPLYVLAKEQDALVIGPAQYLQVREILIQKPVFHLSPNYWPDDIFIKIRSTKKCAPVKIRITTNKIHANFFKPQFPSAPGQTAAIYDKNGLLLGGGIIESMH